MRHVLATLVLAALVPWCTADAQRLPSGFGKAGTTPPETATGAHTYFEPFESVDPDVVFGGSLTIGTDGVWTGTLTGEGYRLENTTAPAAARFAYLLSLPDGTTGALSQGTLRVDVVVNAVHDASYGVGAGMLFDYDPDARSYVAFVLSDTGYAVYVRDDDGLGEVMSGTSDAITPGERHRLTMQATGTEIRLEVDGTHAATISFGRPPEGGIGIIALGAGTFTFTGFAYDAP